VTTVLDRKALLTEFNRDGYVALPAFLNPDEIRDVGQNVDRFIRDRVPALPREHVFYESLGDNSTLKQVQRMFDHDPYFGQWMTDSKFRRLAEILLEGEVTCQNMQYFNKPARVGLPTPPHQDGYYFMLTPCSAVTMWLALDRVDEENGCVRYVTGSHLLGMRAHRRTETLGFSQGITDYPCSNDRSFERAVPAEPGDLLVHHALTVHRADGNSSRTRDRRALGFIYYSVAAEPDAAAQADYQRRLTEEMAEAGKI
jgi:phytanoyl-CoA hydroxylase